MCVRIVWIGGCEYLRFRGGFWGLLFRVEFGIPVSFRGVLLLNVRFKFRIQMAGIWSSLDRDLVFLTFGFCNRDCGGEGPVQISH
jgi:hypothetical protein